MKHERSPVMIFAGGTGGHVFPALAVAKKIEQRGVPVVWAGTKRGIEAQVVTKAGYQVEWIAASSPRGKSAVAYLLAPFRFILVGLQTVWLFIKHWPCAVLSMGGFVAASGGLIAVLLRKPLIVHEQNAIAGLTNRMLAPFATHVLSGFPATFTYRNAVVVGNPISEEILQTQREYVVAEPSSRPLRVLVIGGSQGAQILNKIVPAALARIPLEERPEVWHQTGVRGLCYTRDKYESRNIKARTDTFIDTMHDAYGWADFVICRAGAMTIAELATVGVSAVLVPYPHAIDNHQTINATALADAGAAFLIQEYELNEVILAQLLRDVSKDRSTLKRAVKAVRTFAKPHAADDVANACLQACFGKSTRTTSLEKGLS